MNNSLTFKGTIDSKERELTVTKPTFAQQREAQKVYNTVFNESVRSGSMIRQELDKFMKDRGIWDQDKQVELLELGQKIKENERILERGGVKFSAAVKAAKELKFNLRNRVRNIMSERYALDAHTAEAQADDARFNYLVSVCLVYTDSRKPVFKDIDDYYSRASEEYSIQAARKLMNLIYGFEEDSDSSYVENKFLREFRLVDEKNRLLNKNGELVDQFDNLIDDDGFIVEEVVDRQPFLDDEGCPISTNIVCENTTKEDLLLSSSNNEQMSA